MCSGEWVSACQCVGLDKKAPCFLFFFVDGCDIPAATFYIIQSLSINISLCHSCSPSFTLWVSRCQSDDAPRETAALERSLNFGDILRSISGAHTHTQKYTFTRSLGLNWVHFLLSLNTRFCPVCAKVFQFSHIKIQLNYINIILNFLAEATCIFTFWSTRRKWDSVSLLTRTRGPPILQLGTNLIYSLSYNFPKLRYCCSAFHSSTSYPLIIHWKRWQICLLNLIWFQPDWSRR